MKLKGRNKLGSLLIALSLMLSSSPVGASQILAWGGRLVDSSGSPVSGPATLEVTFYQTAVGGSPVLGPIVHSNVTLADGVFKVTLLLTEAQKADLFANWTTPVFIEIKDTVSGVTIPRQRFTSVPYAIQAQKVPVDEKSFAWDNSGKLVLRPLAAPGSGQFLTRDGNGNLTWGSPPTPTAQTIVGSGTSVPSGRVLMSGAGGTMTWGTPSGSGDMTASTWDSDTNGAIDVAKGGTNATTLSGARTNLGLGSAAVKNVGTAAGDVVELQTGGKLPPVDGSQLSNLPAPNLAAPGAIGGTTPNAGTFTTLNATSLTATSQLTSPSVRVETSSNSVPFYVKGSTSQTAPLAEFRNNADTPLARIGSDGALELKDSDTNWAKLRAHSAMPSDVTWTLPATPSAGQYLTTDGAGNLSWGTPATGGTGDITAVTAGTGLTGGAATGDATLNVDVGTTANKILQLDGNAKIPAVDGSQITNLNMGNATSGTLSIARGGTGATNDADARTALGLGSAATLNAGNAANNLLQLDGTGRIPAGVDASQVTGIGSASIVDGSVTFADWSTNGCTNGTVPLMSSGIWICHTPPAPFTPATPGPIGATTPNTGHFTQVQVVNGADVLTSSVNTGWAQINSNTAAGLKIGPTNAQPLVLQTGALSRVTVTSDGRVGIGTNSPTGLLTVQSSSPATEPLSVQATSGQTAPLQTWKSSGGQVLNRVATNGTMRAHYSRLAGSGGMTLSGTPNVASMFNWVAPSPDALGVTAGGTSIGIPSGRNGLYTIQVSITFNPESTGGNRSVVLKKNGSQVLATENYTASISETAVVTINLLTELLVSETISVEVKSGTASQGINGTMSSLILFHHGTEAP